MRSPVRIHGESNIAAARFVPPHRRHRRLSRDPHRARGESRARDLGARAWGAAVRLELWRDCGPAADLDRAGGRGRAGGALLGAAGVDGGDSAAHHAACFAAAGVRLHPEQSDREPGLGAAGAARGHGHPRRHAQSGDVGARPVVAGASGRGGGGGGGAALCRVRRVGAAVPAAHRGEAAREMGRGGVGRFHRAFLQRAVCCVSAGPSSTPLA